MTWTSHGHHIGGSPQTLPRPNIHRCGGIFLCTKCKAEADSYWNREKEQGMPEVYSSRVQDIEAAQVSEDNAVELARWTGGREGFDPQLLDGTHCVQFPTFAGVESVREGEWIVKDLHTGHFRGMDNETFEKRYQYKSTGDSGNREYTGRELLQEKIDQPLRNAEGSYPNPQRGIDAYQRSSDLNEPKTIDITRLRQPRQI